MWNERCLYDGSLFLPQDCDLSNTSTKCPYVITVDDDFPLGLHVMKPYGGRYLEHAKRILITDSQELDKSVRILMVFQLPDGAFLSDQLMLYLNVALVLQELW